MTDHLPPKGRACHKTFARAEGPIDCRTLVCDHDCQLWQNVSEIIDRDPDTGEPIAKDKFACLEALEGMFKKDMLRRQLQITHTVDKLTKVVEATNAGALGALLGGINQTLQQISEPSRGALTNGNSDQKLIGN